MNRSTSDVETVVSVLTPPGRSALASISIAGPNAKQIARSLFTPIRGTIDLTKDPGPYYGRFGIEPSDDVVLAATSNGNIPTVEIHCHGGSAMVAALLAQIQKAGATIVDWRELLRRQGKSEIIIEATDALARCRTTRVAAILLDQANGALDDAIEQITSNNDRAGARELLSWDMFGLHLVEPWTILLVGPPNVGKSSLLNAILGHERAIVSPTAGTTRDVITGETAIDGWPFVFTDGAGIRQTEDEIERAGISRLERAVESADLCLVVQDLSNSIEKIDVRPFIDRNHLVIGNKADLDSNWSSEDRSELDLIVSAKTGQGIEELLRRIVRRIIPKIPASGSPVPFTRRQIKLLTTLEVDQR